MEIISKRLRLEVITHDDIEDIHILHSFPEVDKFNTNGIPKDIEETRKSVEPFILEQTKFPRKNYTFKVIHQADKEFIGLAGITLSLDKFRLGEIFFKLSPIHWNNGYATEIAEALIKIGFEELNLHRIEAGTNADNFQSIRVLEKIGMHREGLRRKIVPMHGEWKDGYLYGIVEDDPR